MPTILMVYSGSMTPDFLRIYGLTYEDLLRITETFKAVKKTAPAKLIRKEAWLRERAMELRVVGTTSEWFHLVKRPVVAGRILLASDEENQTPVAVLTESGSIQIPDQKIDVYIPLNVAQTYFGDTSFRIISGSFERERVELHQIIVQIDNTDSVEPTAFAGMPTVITPGSILLSLFISISIGAYASHNENFVVFRLFPLLLLFSLSCKLSPFSSSAKHP